MNSTEQIVNRIVEIANSTDHSKDGPHIELYSSVDQLIRLGAVARLAGLKSVHRINHIMARMGVAASLISAESGLHDGIYREALEELSGSDREDDVALFSELVHIFDDRVPRNVLKSALVRARKGASGVLRKNLAYDLRRRGYRLFFGFWV